MIRVLVVDDNSLIREWISILLGLEPDMEVVGQRADGDEVLAAVRDTDPDVVLIDLSMPRTGGDTAIASLRRHAPGVAVVVHSASRDRRHVARALRAGAVSAVDKTGDPAPVIAAVRAAARTAGP
jgi:DNA-binding NarL/FixJ family response regulator